MSLSVGRRLFLTGPLVRRVRSRRQTTLYSDSRRSRSNFLSAIRSASVASARRRPLLEEGNGGQRHRLLSGLGRKFCLLPWLSRGSSVFSPPRPPATPVRTGRERASRGKDEAVDPNRPEKEAEARAENSV